MTYRTLDIEAELAEILNKEEMLVSFDFSYLPAGGETVEGLCTISAPKEGQSKISYVTVVLVIDLPDQRSWQAVDAAINGMDWERFCSLSDEITSVLPNPGRSLKSNTYLKEVSLYLATMGRPESNYCSDVLVPLIAEVTGVKPGAINFWGSAS